MASRIGFGLAEQGIRDFDSGFHTVFSVPVYGIGSMGIWVLRRDRDLQRAFGQDLVGAVAVLDLVVDDALGDGGDFDAAAG